MCCMTWLRDIDVKLPTQLWIFHGKPKQPRNEGAIRVTVTRSDLPKLQRASEIFGKAKKVSGSNWGVSKSDTKELTMQPFNAT